MDSLFFLTISVIFISAVIGVYTRRRSLDGCLKDFAGYQVTIELKDGHLIWGNLEVFSSGIELVYRVSHQDDGGHTETSYILFPADLESIQAIYRYHDELVPERQNERLKDIDRSYHPSSWRRLRRKTRNFFNTFRDAFNQSLGVAMSQVKKGQGAAVLKAQNKNVASIGDTVLGSVANAYEPIMERYIGHRVVLEESRGDEVIEHPGILKEYTAEWIEVLDSTRMAEHAFCLKEPDQLSLNRDLDFIVHRTEHDGEVSLTLRIENHGTKPVSCKRLVSGEWSQDLESPVPAGGTLDLSLGQVPATELAILRDPKTPAELAFRAESRMTNAEASLSSDGQNKLPDITLIVEASRAVDLCFPRRCATLRHGGEAISP